jgi:hypothetical protein
VQELEDEDDDDERASMRTEIPKGPLVSYSRTELLKLARKEGVPQAMPTLESWFGCVLWLPQHHYTDSRKVLGRQAKQRLHPPMARTTLAMMARAISAVMPG